MIVIATLLPEQVTVKKRFLIFAIDFSNLHQILNILRKNMILIATLLQKLEAVKELVRPLSTKHGFRKPFKSQHIEGSQTFVKSA